MFDRSTLLVPFAGLLAAALALPVQDDPPRLGAGEHTYEWVRGWPRMPEGVGLGNTHGCIVVDSKDRIYVNTDTRNAVMVFDQDGNLLRSFGEELAGGLHGMTIFERDGEEHILAAHIGLHEVLELDLEGNVLWRAGYPEASGLYESADQYRPTSVVPLPEGGFIVADGYGKSYLHLYDAEHRYVRTLAGPGQEPGLLRTPHGLFLDQRGDTPVLVVADRGNGRLQRFSLAGELLGAVEGKLRRPCHAHPGGKDLVVPDLAGRVTILDDHDEVLAHLGDNPDPAKRARNDVPVEEWRDGEFISPHCANWDSAGNLYVMDWVAPGRVTKLRRVR